MRVHEHTVGAISAIWTEAGEPEGQPTLVLVNTDDRAMAGGITRTLLDPSRLEEIIESLAGLLAILTGETPDTVREYVEERDLGERITFDPGPKVNPLTIESRAAREQMISEVAGAVSEVEEHGQLCPSCGKAYALPSCPVCGWTESWRKP